jgi:hypothetical protein
VKSNNFYIRFDSDGTFRQAHAPDQLESQLYVTSTFQFEGTEFTMKEISVSGVPSFGEKIGRYEIQLLENGSIRIVEIKDECPSSSGETAGMYDPVQ